MNNFISHKNGELYSVLNAAQILCLNRPRQVAYAALIEAGVSDPDKILDSQANPETVWACLVNALNVANENTRLESEGLKASIDALTDYVGQLASEIELRDSHEIIHTRIARLKATIRLNIPAYRRWLQNSTIPNFDVNRDDLVANWAMGNTKIGKELTYLEGILNG